MTKKLGLLNIFCIASGAMISSGLFVLPGLAHAQAGPAVIFSYFFAGLLAAAGLLSIAELTTAMPRAGGDYFYISRGLGPAMGIVVGLFSWLSLSLKSAFALIGMAVLTAVFLPVNWHITAVALCLVFVLINLLGTKEAADFQVVLVLSLLALMAVFIFKGFGEVDFEKLKDFTPHGVRSVMSTTGFVFVSYGGLIQVASVAGEIKNPGRTIPRGMILAVIVIVILYTLMIFVTSGVLESAKLDKSLTPISDAAEVFMGKTGYILVSIAAALAFITTANAGIMTASRYLLAVSKDDLLPSFLSKISERFHTPYNAIIITGAVIIIAVFINLNTLVKAASTVFVLGYIFAGISIIIIRESGVQNYKPVFKAPFYPWLQIITIAGFAFILYEMGEDVFYITAIMGIAGFLLYWFYARKRVEKDYALLHLLEKITAKELVSGRLENELKEIIRDRDEIIIDRFDHLVDRAEAIDIDEKMRLEEFFELASDRLSAKLSVDKTKIKKLLTERETESSTVLSDQLAVPHIVIEGEDKFEMLLVRCKKGIEFSPKHKKITTVFVLAGSKDLRNFYLRVLSAIAHIVQKSDFESNWLAARNVQALKDIVLLSKRKPVK